MSLLSDVQVDKAIVELCEERALVYHDLLAAQNLASQDVIAAIARSGTVLAPTSAGFLSANGLKSAGTGPAEPLFFQCFPDIDPATAPILASLPASRRAMTP